MDTRKLYDILHDTTVQLRNGPEVQHSQVDGVSVTEVYDMPPVAAAPSSLELVDLSFLTIGVDKAKAEKRRDELVALLKTYPEPGRLEQGPSYIEIGAEIGDQGSAFQLFALGQVLGLWTVITPERLGLTGDLARQAAGSGYIMIDGFRP